VSSRGCRVLGPQINSSHQADRLSDAPTTGRARWALWTFVLVLVAGMAWVALVYTGPVPTITQLGEWNDKALHVGAFGVLALMVVLPGPAPRALLAMVLCAGLLELAQLAFPLRQASLADLAASVVGVVAGWVIGAMARTAIVLSWEGAR
jgi:VanZ family protein